MVYIKPFSNIDTLMYSIYGQQASKNPITPIYGFMANGLLMARVPLHKLNEYTNPSM